MVVQVTRGVKCEVHDDNRIWTISVQSLVIQDCGPDWVFFRDIRVSPGIRFETGLIFRNGHVAGVQVWSSETDMCHREIQNQWVRRQTVVVPATQDDVILDLNQCPRVHFQLLGCDRVNLNLMSHRTHHRTEPVDDPIVSQNWSRTKSPIVSLGTCHHVFDKWYDWENLSVSRSPCAKDFHQVRSLSFHN